MTEKKLTVSRAALLGFVMLGAANCLGQETPAMKVREWSGSIVPYLYLFGFNGTVTVDGTEGDVDAGIDQLLDNLRWGGYLRAEVWNEETWGVVFDGGMTWLEEDFKEAGITTAEASFRWGRFDLMAAYRLVNKLVGRRNRDRLAIDAFGGLRTQYLRQELRRETGEREGDNATWVEPVVGARVQRQVSTVVTLLGEGDASGFGIGNASNLTWNLRGGADIAVSGRLTFRLMYNVTGIDYSTGSGSDKFGLDGIAHGPMLGLVFNF